MRTSTQPSFGAGSSKSEWAGARSTTLLMCVGAVEIALGLIAIVWPALASVSIAILLGSLLLVEGVVALVGAFAARGWHMLARLAWSLVSGLAGIYLLAYPDDGVVGLTMVLVIVMFLAGIALVAAGVLGEANRGMLIFVGTLDVVLGALIWAKLPSSADWALGLLVGFHFLGRGLETISVGREERRRTKETGAAATTS